MPSKYFTSMGLANNELITVPSMTNFVVSNTLERLNLAGNFFLSLGKYSLKAFPGMGRRLEYLILRRSNIRSIESDAFENLDKLKYVNLAENQLRHVPDAVKLPLIEHLDLSFQCYTSICDM